MKYFLAIVHCLLNYIFFAGIIVDKSEVVARSPMLKSKAIF